MNGDLSIRILPHRALYVYGSSPFLVGKLQPTEMKEYCLFKPLLVSITHCSDFELPDFSVDGFS